MNIKHLQGALSVSEQIKLADLKHIAASGIKTVINNRPDAEAPRQPRSETLSKRAQDLGLTYYYIPVISGGMTDENVSDFAKVLEKTEGQVLAFCRTGTRSTTLWAKSQKDLMPADSIISEASKAGYDLSKMKAALTSDDTKQNTNVKTQGTKMTNSTRNISHQIVIIGGGSAGIATAASLLKRKPSLDIAIIEPKEEHFYQPGWTMVGGGIFTPEKTRRSMKDLMPKSVKWIKASVSTFDPDNNLQI